MKTIIAKCPGCGTGNRVPVLKQHLHPKCGKCGRPLDLHSAMVPVDLDEADLQELISGASLPLLVDFYSPTCGPCQMLAPVLDALARRYAGRLLCAKLNTSRYPQAAARYRVQGVPTLFFFHRGQVIDQVVGAAGEAMLVQKIEALLTRL